MDNNNISLNDGVYDGYLQLVGAIFRLCSQDVKYGRVNDVAYFVDSQWFEDLCDYIEIDPKEVKKRIFSKKVKQRAEYH
jgi:myosin heavy subunit